MKARLLGGTALGAVALTIGAYFLGFAWDPSGDAPRAVLDGRGCSVSDGNVTVDAPAPTSALGDEAGSWSLLAYDAAVVLRTGLGGYGAERYVKAQLPWTVRMRLVWDSESDLLAAYGTQEDICMVARVVEERRLLLAQESTAHAFR